MSVCNLSAESAIAMLVERILPRGASVNCDDGCGGKWHDARKPSRGLYVAVELQMDVYDDDDDAKDVHGRRVVHLVFHRPSNYTKVWACVNDQWQLPKPEEFTMRADHDMLGEVRDARSDKQPSEHNTVHAIRDVELQYFGIGHYDKKLTLLRFV